MCEKAPYRNITASVRTPRFAILIEKNEKYWKAYVNGLIQSVSQAWGGEYFIMVPTDGKTIDDKFWEILEAYNPDKIGRYIPNLLDMEEAEPDAYRQVKDNYRVAWKLPDDEFEKHWSEQIKSGNIGGLEVSKELSEELKNRLSPFHFEDHIVGENVFRNSVLGFPFTQIENIVETAKNKPTKITVPMEVDDSDYKLLALSRAGALSKDYQDKLENKGLTAAPLPSGSSSFRLRDYIIALEKDEYDDKFQKAFSDYLGEEAGEYPEDDFLPNLPFKLSMLHLGEFYRRDTHREEEENLLIIVGDSFEDYCLYYSLSRMHEGVYWLPDRHLMAAYRKHKSNKNRAEDEEVVKYTVEEDLAAALVWEYFSIIRYGHTPKSIDITSASLTSRQLANRRKVMAELVVTDAQEFLANTNVKPLEDVAPICVMRVIEANNHANQQEMIFQNGRGVGRVNTPKPKNFSPVNPAEHRWITSLEVDNYHPPSLPFLGPQIIQLRNMSWETRVASDGLAYLCPNIGYFGGDIDVNTVRPELNLISEDEMFNKYFANSGFTTELSDKGSYLKDTINRFGSLEETAAFFRSEPKRNLLDQFLIDKKHQDSEAIYLDAENRVYISFDAFSRKLSGDEEAELLVEELIRKNILSRGFIFQCSRCRLSAWYDISAVTNEFTCTRCGLTQAYTKENWKSPSEPRWYYRLAETVYLCYKSSSHITALALDTLRQEAPGEFHYVSETNIINPLSEKPKREIDILAIFKGRIILGECKDCPVVKADIRKYLTIFAELHIKPFQFLLATTEEGVTADVQAELGKFKNHRLFTRKELYE